MAAVLPSYAPPRSHKRSFLPRSRITSVLALLLGSFSLYSFYSLATPDTPWHFSPRLHPYQPPPPTQDTAALVWQSRADDVKQSFLHAWQSYERHAWGMDELLPLSGTHVHNFNGWGVSIVDALDTLLIMDLRPQFARAVDHVASMTFNQTAYEVAPFFETTIRYLGGLLSAYAIVVDAGDTSAIPWQPDKFDYRPIRPATATFDENGALVTALPDPAMGSGSTSASEYDEAFDKRYIPPPPSFTSSNFRERNRIASILLTRADHLARALLPAFNTSSGLPVFGVNTISGKQRNNWSSLLAEIGSCQMEYKYLAHITGRREYFDVVNKVSDILETLQEKQLKEESVMGGMLPTHYSVNSGGPVDNYMAVGALADSAYEYLLKGYLLSGRSERRLLDMYLKSVDTALHNLTYVSPERDLLYITDAYGFSPSHKMEHLSCFYPGLLALGVELLNSSEDHPSGPEMTQNDSERHLWAARGIAETCWVLYADNPTGLGSEEVDFDRPMVPMESEVKTDGEPNTAVTNPPILVSVNASYNRWWDLVDAWEAGGRTSEFPPGVHGADRKPVITNGGKGSWQVTAGTPGENERPLEDTEQSTSPPAEGQVFPSQQRIHRTHLRDYSVRDDRWLMRPETIESLYLLHRVTGEQVWRDRCYAIYRAIETYSRAPIGYASVRGVDYDIDLETNMPKGIDLNSTDSTRYRWKSWSRFENSMPSYALAETFKYLYLCMLDPKESAALLPSNHWIFNTEAHPLPVFDWSELERTEWDIR